MQYYCVPQLCNVVVHHYLILLCCLLSDSMLFVMSPEYYRPDFVKIAESSDLPFRQDVNGIEVNEVTKQQVLVQYLKVIFTVFFILVPSLLSTW